MPRWFGSNWTASRWDAAHWLGPNSTGGGGGSEVEAQGALAALAALSCGPIRYRPFVSSAVGSAAALQSGSLVLAGAVSAVGIATQDLAANRIRSVIQSATAGGSAGSVGAVTRGAVGTGAGVAVASLPVVRLLPGGGGLAGGATASSTTTNRRRSVAPSATSLASAAGAPNRRSSGGGAFAVVVLTDLGANVTLPVEGQFVTGVQSVAAGRVLLGGHSDLYLNTLGLGVPSRLRNFSADLSAPSLAELVAGREVLGAVSLVTSAVAEVSPLRLLSSGVQAFGGSTGEFRSSRVRPVGAEVDGVATSDFIAILLSEVVLVLPFNPAVVSGLLESVGVGNFYGFRSGVNCGVSAVVPVACVSGTEVVTGVTLNG